MKTVLGVVLLFVAATLSAQPAAVELPPALDRVLRDYEKSWSAKDPAALADLFTEDGFVLSNGKPPVRGRTAIREAYAGSGGPLFLRAFEYKTDGATGYIVGGYRAEEAKPDHGKFVLVLRKHATGKWLIAADIDNVNQHAKPQ
jgi:ketosteroid isomerase-like protein